MPLGPLRAQLTYPRPADSISDAAATALLDAVGLPSLADRVGGLGAECEWAYVLSLGEQQRLAAARLLAATPDVAFLDEATGALDAATEAAVYSRVRASVPCYVSIGKKG